MAATLANKVLAVMTQRKLTRVSRDGLVDYFCKARGGFRSLPAYEEAALSPEGKARNPVNGWTVPQSELGRTGRGADVSVRNSLAAWIRKNLLPTMAECGGPVLTMDQIAIHLEGEGKGQHVVIYRKK